MENTESSVYVQNPQNNQQSDSLYTILKITIVFVLLFIVLIVGILFIRNRNTTQDNLASSNVPTPTANVITTSPTPIPNVDVASITSVAENQYPIDPSLDAVLSADLTYRITGRIQSISTNDGNVNLTLYDVKGVPVDKTFTFPSGQIDVVELNREGKETPSDEKEMKVNDPIQISYYVDLKNSSKGQMTKIFIERY